ncbi:MAG: S16 family serine protease [Tepidisphaeraceae bacterium]
MRHLLHSVIAAAVCILALCNSRALAGDDSMLAGGGDAVQVQFASGDTDVDALANGVKLFSNQDCVLDKFPSEMANLNFTRRPWKAASDVTIDAPSGSTVYVFVGEGPMAAGARGTLASTGWTRFAELHFKGDQSGPMAIYKQSFAESQHLTIPADRGSLGAMVAARQLTLSNPQPSDEKPKDETSQAGASSNVALQNSVTGAPTTRISKLQASIKALYVREQDNGDALGLASDLILTVTPGLPKDNSIPVKFTSPVGSQMYLVLDDVARAINAKHPGIVARKLEFSFEDKYTPKDGGSIGAALGTLMLSVIEGFDVDPQFAITGDVSADGRIRVVGGVGAKLRGAKDAGCTLVALPNEDFEELVDAVIYNGVSEITNVQVIGISTLDDAVAVARTDRAAKEGDAINLFSEIQESMQASPNYLRTDEALNKLKRVADLAPNHLSARLLLQIAQNKQRKRLTALASEYYAIMGLASVIPMLTDRDVATGTQHLMPAAVDRAIRELRRLRPISDLRIQPFVDACIELIQARSDYDVGAGSHEALMESFRVYRDELDKLQADRALREKMLHEGV